MILRMRSGSGWRRCYRVIRAGAAGGLITGARSTGSCSGPDGLPGEYGHWLTGYRGRRRWSCDGTWAGTLDRLRARCDEAEVGGWTVSVDSTVVRAYQHAAG